MSTYDFGGGLVPAHRHSNGGGWVADTARVSDRAYVGPAARVAGGDIRGGTIRGGTIYDGTIYDGTIWGGDIRGGDIRGGTIRGGTIRGGIIWGGDIRGGTIWGGTISGGDIWGGTTWGGYIYGGDIRGGVIRSTRDLLVIGPVGSENQVVTLVRNDDTHLLGVGCWHGHTVDELAAEVQRRCPDKADEYALVEALLRHRLAEWGQA